MYIYSMCSKKKNKTFCYYSTFIIKAKKPYPMRKQVKSFRELGQIFSELEKTY